MSPLKEINVLVVDDELVLRDIFREMFEAAGANVFVAVSGKSAQQILRSNKISLVLSDIKMADGDGIELLQWIQYEYDSEIPVFLISGFSNYTREEVIKLGARDLFRKPFNEAQIMSTMTAAII